MDKYSYTCPICNGQSAVECAPGGMADLLMLRCDTCSKATFIPIYDGVLQQLSRSFPLQKVFYEKISEALENCACGGVFRVDAIPRCSRCLKPIDIDALKHQVKGPIACQLVSNGKVDFVWRKICSFCGNEDSSAKLIDPENRVYICDKCQNP